MKRTIAAFLALTLVTLWAVPSEAASTKISAMTSGGTLLSTDTVPAVRAGANVKGALLSANQLSVYSAGTVYTLTATPALVDFGTTDPSLTLSAAGTYLIMARARIDSVGATFATARVLTTKLRRTNNTAADVTNGAATLTTGVVTTLTGQLGAPSWWAIYTTTNSDDIIQMFGDVSVLPSAGSVTVNEASIVAIRLQQ